MTIEENVKKVIAVVCENYGIKSQQMKTNAGKPYPEARAMVYYIVKKVLDIQINNRDLDNIVRNKLDNSTVSGNVIKFTNNITINNKLRARLENVMSIYWNNEVSLSKSIRTKLSYLIQMNDIDVIKNEIGVIISKINTNTI